MKIISKSPAHPPKPLKSPSPDAVRRAVASSTALATGVPVAEVERQLQQALIRFPHVTLAR
jgi:hypothetical protein